MEDAKESLRISVFQICSSDSFEQNSKEILNKLKVHDLQNVDLCVFPENALYININKKDRAPKISLANDFFKEIQGLAKKNNVAFHLGSMPLYKADKLYNTSLWVDTDGSMTEAYNKIHLFAAQIGPLCIDEGKSYFPGEGPAVVELKGWRIGLSICFDLRFSEIYSYYAKDNCDLVLVPSAFFRKTGEAHWELLLKARAVEGQCYVVAPAQAGTHRSTKGEEIRKSYGHSLAVHPWGNLLMDLGESESAVETVELFKTEIGKIRKSVIMKRRM